MSKFDTIDVSAYFSKVIHSEVHNSTLYCVDHDLSDHSKLRHVTDADFISEQIVFKVTLH